MNKRSKSKPCLFCHWLFMSRVPVTIRSEQSRRLYRLQQQKDKQRLLMFALLFAMLLLPMVVQAGKVMPTKYDSYNGAYWTQTMLFYDESFTGAGDKESPHVKLTGGIGDLADGVVDPNLGLKAEGYFGPGPNICWTGVDPEITFYFSKVRDFKTMRIDFPDQYLMYSHLAKAIKIDITIEGEKKTIDIPKAEVAENTRKWYDFDLSGMPPTDKIKIKLYRNRDVLVHAGSNIGKGLMCTSEIEFFDGASALKIDDVPITLNTNVNPNVMVVLDNSQSMDAHMNGVPVSGQVSLDRQAVWTYFEDFEDFQAYKTAPSNDWFGAGKFDSCPGCTAEWSGGGRVESTWGFNSYGLGNWAWRNRTPKAPASCKIGYFKPVLANDDYGDCTTLGQKTVLKLKNVPPHKELILTFNLVEWDSIDGAPHEPNFTAGGQDLFVVEMDGRRLISNYFIGNWPSPKQVVDSGGVIKYHHRGGFGGSLRFDTNNVGATEKEMEGESNPSAQWGEQYRNVTLYVPHERTATGDVEISFWFPNSQGGSDESFSVDNVMVTATNDSNDPAAEGEDTRSNIARQSLRSVMDEFNDAINWGLTSFEVDKTQQTLNTTYSYVMGSNSTLDFTPSCTGYKPPSFELGLPFKPGCTSASGTLVQNTEGAWVCSAGSRCLQNPEWREVWNSDPSLAAFKYIKYEKSSDDPTVLDVLYLDRYNYSPQFGGIWAPQVGNNAFATYAARDNTYLNQAFKLGNPSPFTNFIASLGLAPTDAGYIPKGEYSRVLMLPRGWGYQAPITGKGTVNLGLGKGELSHLGQIKQFLGPESLDASTSAIEIKNSATFTPIKGTMETVYDYFRQDYNDRKANNTNYSCQYHYSLLVTDGVPTANSNGQIYSEADRDHTCVWDDKINGCATGTLKTAATEARDVITNLRAMEIDASHAGIDREVTTFVIAMADAVANKKSVSVMHALAYAGGGFPTAFLASDEESFRDALSRIAENIQRRGGSASAPVPQDSDVYEDEVKQAIYYSAYNSNGWHGRLYAIPKDISTGLNDTAHPFWEAADKFDVKYPLTTAVPPLRTGLSARRIITATDAGGVGGSNVGLEFKCSELSSDQKTWLKCHNDSDLLNYLSGFKEQENKKFRERTGPIGDILNAAAVVVLPPEVAYDGDRNLGLQDFVDQNKDRVRMIYQPANDGLLHAFRAVSDPAAATQNAADGHELWAYMPNLILDEIAALSKRGRFIHKMYIDATPVAANVDFNYKGQDLAAYTNATKDWRTLLVGGLGKGGRGFYALDVTQPDAANMSKLREKVLWEFPKSITDPTMRAEVTRKVGYSFGNPLIVKTKARGWVVMLTSGYNNGADTGGDGLGHLFIVDPKTGDLIKTLTTPNCRLNGNRGLACGLSKLTPFMPDTQDPVVEYVYGADLYGQVWRFDFTGANVNDWEVKLMAELKDGVDGGAQPAKRQPVTGAPIVTKVHLNGEDVRFLYIGTGQYLSSDDVPTTDVHTIYGLIDKGNKQDGFLDKAEFARNKLQSQEFSWGSNEEGETIRNVTSNEVNFDTQNGWYIDLLEDKDSDGAWVKEGERMVRNMRLAGEMLVFPTFIPSRTPCTVGGESRKNFLSYLSGGLVSAKGYASTVVDGLLNDVSIITVRSRGDNVVRKYIIDESVDNPDNIYGETSTVTYPTPKRVYWREIIR